MIQFTVTVLIRLQAAADKVILGFSRKKDFPLWWP